MLAEAATHLSFAAFLERCIFVNAAPPPQLPVPTPPLDAATQTFPHTAASRDVSTQLSFKEFLAPPSTHDVLCPTCSRPVPSLLLDACRRLCTASHFTMPPHNYRSRSSSSGVASPMTLQTAKPRHRHIAMLGAPHRHNPLTLLRFAAPAAPAMPAMVTSTLWPHVCYYSHHWVSRSMPVDTPHMVYLLKRHRCDLVCVQLSQSRPHSHMSVPPKWEHILCAQVLPTREVQVPPLREPTILLVQILVQEQVLSLNHEPWYSPWSNLGNPKLTGSVTLIQLALISCIINTVSLFFRAQRAETPPQRLADGFMRLSFKKPVIMFRTSPISSLRILVTRTLLSYSTRTPSSPTLWCLPSGTTPQAKVLGAWFYSSFEHCCAAPHLPGHQR